MGRIQSLATWINDGRIMFARNQRLLIDQLKYFPKAAHDDGPDALAMVVLSSGGNEVGFVPLTGELSAKEREEMDGYVSTSGYRVTDRDYGKNYKIDDGEDD